MPLKSVLLLIVMFSLPPRSRTVPEFVEPMLTLPLIVPVLTKENAIPSEVPPTSSLFVMSRFRAEEARRSEEHTSELQSLAYLVCRLLLEKKKKKSDKHRQSI